MRTFGIKLLNYKPPNYTSSNHIYISITLYCFCVREFYKVFYQESHSNYTMLLIWL